MCHSVNKNTRGIQGKGCSFRPSVKTIPTSLPREPRTDPTFHFKILTVNLEPGCGSLAFVRVQRCDRCGQALGAAEGSDAAGSAGVGAGRGLRKGKVREFRRSAAHPGLAG